MLTLQSGVSRGGIDNLALFTKIYRVEDADIVDVSRIEKINTLSKLIMPHVTILIIGSDIVVSQDLILEYTSFKSEYSVNNLLVLASMVDCWHQEELVHGDLCLSNLGSHRDAVYVFDWEPLLVWGHDCGVMLRTTPYCLHPHDKKKRCISKLTDRYAVAVLLLIKAKSIKGRRFYISEHKKTAAEYSADDRYRCTDIVRKMADRVGISDYAFL